MDAPSPATCAICGNVSPVWPADALPEPAEPPDFDTRPGEPLRSTIVRWIQVCPVCGYAAEDISAASSAADAIVRSDQFQELRSDADIPEQARGFLCFAYMLDKLHQHADAGWSCLHAAWVCDDLGAGGAASWCRGRALEIWKQGKAVGQAFGDDVGSEFALVTDICRRTGRFEEATVTCAEGLDTDDIVPAVEAILRRQMVLIQARDTAAHSMRELMYGSPVA